MQQKCELPADATLADMIRMCDELIAHGYIVHIEYIQAQKRFTVYGEDVPEPIRTLKAEYSILAAHPPAPQGKKWDDYQALMQGLERQLREAGVEL